LSVDEIIMRENLTESCGHGVCLYGISVVVLKFGGCAYDPYMRCICRYQIDIEGDLYGSSIEFFMAVSRKMK